MNQIKLIPFWIKWWYQGLFPNENEFHKSYDLNVKALILMTDHQQYQYRLTLFKRRDAAHFNDFLKWDQ